MDIAQRYCEITMHIQKTETEIGGRTKFYMKVQHMHLPLKHRRKLLFVDHLGNSYQIFLAKNRQTLPFPFSLTALHTYNVII